MAKSRFSRRRRSRVFSSRFSKLGPRRNRRCGFEPLEVRQVLSASAGGVFEGLLNKVSDSTQIVGPLAPAQAMFPEVEDAFRRVSRLDQYSQEQLEQTSRWVVHTAYEIGSQALAAASGAVSLEVFSGVPDVFIYNIEDGESPQEIVDRFGDLSFVDYFYPLVPHEGTLLAAQGHVPNDPLLNQQWHLVNTGQLVVQPNGPQEFGTWGEDIRVLPVWHEGITGEGVTIGIVDDGLQYTHPDLAPNYDPTLSYDFDGLDEDPFPDLTPPGGMLTPGDWHGTAVAGLAAGKGDNGIGITGVAYNATIGGIRLPFSQLGQITFTDENIFLALTHENQRIDIYNNSWGNTNPSLSTIGPLHMTALRQAAYLGRGGLGNILMISAGNAGLEHVSANFDSFSNTRFGIVVSAIQENGVSSDYSSGGSNVFIASPSNSGGGSTMVTTDITDHRGYNAEGIIDDSEGLAAIGAGDFDFLPDPNYTSTFGGTSAAAPVASGVVALMLEANPNLTFRDVQHILARSARKNDPTNYGWNLNGDGIFRDFEWENDPAGFIFSGGVDGDTTYLPPLNVTNGAGYQIHDYRIPSGGGQNHSYGHGAIDAQLAVALAKTWQTIRPEAVPLSTGTVVFPGDSGRIPASEVICDPANYRIPGGIGGESGFGEAWAQWVCPEDPDMPPDPLPVNTRGGTFTFSMPDSMMVETVEVRVLFDEIPEDASDNLRIALVSPNGTHSDFTNYIPLNGNRPNPLAVGGSVEHTFTTIQHWGERTGNTYDPETGETLGTWEFVVENWSDSEMHIQELEVRFNGTRIDAGRVQGFVGIDTDGTDGYDYEARTEPLASEAVIYVDINGDNMLTRDHDGKVIEPMFTTGADGNYHFDLPAADVPYHFRVQPPPGYEVVGDDEIEVTIEQAIITLTDPETGEPVLDPDTGEPQTVALTNPFGGPLILPDTDVNFTLRPEPIKFEGAIFADFNGSGAFEPEHDGPADDFIVFIDLNGNGEFDFKDTNGNLVYDPPGPDGTGGDQALDPVDVTGLDGRYSIEVHPGLAPDPLNYPGFSGFRGNDFYTLMVQDREDWALTNPLAPLFSPDGAFYRLFAHGQNDNNPSDEFSVVFRNLDFLYEPEHARLEGVVYQDRDADGLRDDNESGLSGFTVYLDLDNNGRLGIGEPQTVTNSSGRYVFADMEPGRYNVRIEMTAQQRSTWAQITPVADEECPNPACVELFAGAPEFQNFGLHRMGTVHGVVYHDENDNGARENAEPELKGVTVFVDADGDGRLDSTEPRMVTAEDGAYEFRDLNAGMHMIRVVETAGFKYASPMNGMHQVDVDPSGVLSASDFGMQEAVPTDGTIQGRIFDERNGNGLGGFTVYVDLNGNGVQDAGENFGVTDAIGAYAIDAGDLPDGTYTVRLKTVSGLQFHQPVSGGQPVDLGSGGALGTDFAVRDNTTVDLGSAPPPYADARHRKPTSSNGTPFLLGATFANDGIEPFVSGAVELRPGETYTIDVTASRAGAFLQAWIDYSGDGDWGDAGERVFTNRSLRLGLNELTFTVPEHATGGDDGEAYARFRLGEFDLNSPTSEAAVGEVEDYRVEIITEPPNPADLDGDGIVSHADGQIVRQNLGTTFGATPGMGDLDRDGDVDGNDLLDWLLAAAGVEQAASASAAAPAALSAGHLDAAGDAQALATPIAALNQSVGGAVLAAAQRARASAGSELVLSHGSETPSWKLDPVSGSASSVDPAFRQPQAARPTFARSVERDVALAELGKTFQSKSRLEAKDAVRTVQPLKPGDVDSALALAFADQGDWRLA